MTDRNRLAREILGDVDPTADGAPDPTGPATGEGPAAPRRRTGTALTALGVGVGILAVTGTLALAGPGAEAPIIVPTTCCIFVE